MPDWRLTPAVSIAVFPCSCSVVDTNKFVPVDPNLSVSPYKPFTVGWIGSPSTARYLQLLIEPLHQLARERHIRLIIVGGPAPVIPGVEVIEQPWSLDKEVH